MSPKVSVVMSVYNGSHYYLQEAVNSILNQTFTDFEFIIIDDCSTDNQICQILSEYAKQDQRIKLLKNEANLGLTKSLNKGLSIAQGEYIARMDADDISLKTRLDKQVKVLNEKAEIVLVSCNLEYINSNGEKVGECKRDAPPHIVAWNLLFYNHIGGHSQVMFRRNPVIELGGYSEAIPYAQDYELWLRLLNIGDFFILPETLLKYRQGDANKISIQKKEEQKRYLLLSVGKNIEKLIGLKLTDKEIEALENFWYREKIVYPEVIQSLSNIIDSLYIAFYQERVTNRKKSEDMKLLRKLISEKFLDSSNKTNKATILSKIFLLYQSWKWDIQKSLSWGFQKLSNKLMYKEVS